MKIYRLVDNGSPEGFTADLATVGKWFIQMAKKYPQQTWYWLEEDDL